jgi:plasmid maintenance system antidote protein VapI
MLQETTRNLQAEFLDQVRSRLSEKISFVETLASLLEISRDSAYRRIRGETVLSMDEAKKLCDLFGISLDAHFSSSANSSLFHHRALSSSYSLDRWLNSVAKNFTFFNSFEHKEMIFAARDMPIFHHFRLPELAAFKLFVSLKTVIKDPAFANLNFSFHALPDETMKAAKRIWQLYSTIPTVEIWSDEAINETLKQIAFYHECGFFENATQP